MSQANVGSTAKGATAALALLFFVNMLNFFDRQILGVVGEQIRKEWELSDTALGMLGTVFTVMYAIVGLPLGRLSDRMSRMKLISGGVVVWSALTAASGLCTSFVQLCVARLGVGVGEAVCAPAASSLIGDLFPAHKRANAVSMFMMGLPIGIAASFFVGGYVARTWGWEAAFFAPLIPGLLCAVWAWFTPEPIRGGSEVHAIGTTQREGSAFALVLSIPTMWWVIASGALHNFNMYAIGSFMAPFLMRHHQLDLMNGATYSAITYGLSGIPGLLIGGILADRMSARSNNGRMVLTAITFALAAPLTYLGLSQPPGATLAFLGFMASGIACMYVYYAATYSTIQELVEPSLRGMAMAIYFFAMYIFGASLGPYATGFLSDMFVLDAARAAGVTATDAASLEPFKGAGLLKAMYVIPIFNVLLAGCMFAASRTVGNDVAKLHAWMKTASTRA
jgi:MFS family permease